MNSNIIDDSSSNQNLITQEELEQLKIDFALFQDISETMEQGILVYDTGRILFSNARAEQLLEFPSGLISPGKPWKEYLEFSLKRGDYGEPEKWQEKFIEIERKIQLGESRTHIRKMPSGALIRSDAKTRTSGGQIVTLTDISNHQVLETELEEVKNLNELSNNVLNNLSNPVFVKDSDLLYTIVNDAFCRLVGHSREDLLGKSAFNFFDAEVAASFSDHERQSLITGIPDQKEEDIPHAEDGITWSAITNKNRVTSSSGDAYLVGVVNNITELKNRERELESATKVAESAERAKSEFLANMSHEIRTPMNGVMGMAELLVSTELDAKQKMFTDVIVKSGASLLTIINDILDFSKIDAGQMELDPAPFNLAEAIEDVATLVSSKVAEKDLELIVRVDPALPKTMVSDVGRIRQIVTNLLGNAVKFTEKGHVFVNIESQGSRKEDDTDIASLKFSIEDTGIGIPQEQCDQVFQKFSQVDTSATRKHEGTGLGLSISSSLVNLMGGNIGVESEVGKGTTFWFSVDLPTHGEDEDKQVVPGDMTGARILVIDDNKVNRSILAEQMAAWKFDGASTSTGAKGLDVMRAVIANKMSLDLVILDYQMPEMSGAEVLETMRGDEALKDIPVVMLTSVDSSQTNQKLQELGAEANLTKPTRSSMLLETILQVIANKRADVKTRAISNLTARSVPDTDHITLPTGERQPSVITSESQGLDILVAEDNEVNQIVFRQILEETGLNFKIVGNGRLALATYKVQQPRLILMDVSMPEMNGKEATTAIRKYEREKEMNRVPIVGVTAHALKGDMEACIDAGMDDYLSKPVSPNKLSLKIEQWLKVDLKNKIQT